MLWACCLQMRSGDNPHARLILDAATAAATKRWVGGAGMWVL